MLSIGEAFNLILTQMPKRASVSVALRDLTHCVLAQAITMERDQPPFDRVTMDGIALNSQSTQRALHIIGTQAAGDAPLQLPSTDVCIEVMTGAQLPLGCDCVVPVEQMQRIDGSAHLHAAVTPRAYLNIHLRGSDARQHQVMLHAGTPIGMTELAVIASAGYASVQAITPPRIALISTGNELVEPGLPIADWQIRRSNSYALRAGLSTHGFTQLSDHHLPDDVAILRSALTELLLQHDVLILSGGVSMGKFDHVPQILTELGVRCVFHKIAQRPGKPMWFGVRDDGKAVYALPGNPVSTALCLYRYVLPGLRASMGVTLPAPEQVSLSDAAHSHAELGVFMPVTLHTQSANIQAMPKPTRGSGDFISLLGTHGFVELPTATTPIAAGTAVPLYRW